MFKTPPVTTRSHGREIDPFFIIGSGRSGTTLLRSILQRHPEIDIPPESHGAIPNSVKKFYRYGGLDWQDLVNVVLGEFLSDAHFGLWEIDLSEARRRALTLEDREKSLARIIDLIYREHMETHKPDAVRWGDKSPFNTLRLEWVRKVFPSARYVHIIRDGRDVVSSFLKSGLMDDINRACRRWNMALDESERHAKRSGTAVLTLYYEQLVKEPEEQVKRTCRFLDIDFVETMLNEKEVYLGDEHLDHLKNVTNPITDKSIGKWKERLTEKQQEVVSQKLASNLKKHKYI
ncbi:MAG: sulfotransferase [Balneolaceae bacterium]|nr:sulfotransferase [Balneolaceae bacterium]